MLYTTNPYVSVAMAFSLAAVLSTVSQSRVRHIGLRPVKRVLSGLIVVETSLSDVIQAQHSSCVTNQARATFYDLHYYYSFNNKYTPNNHRITLNLFLGL